MLNTSNISHVIYFAIDEMLRNKGYGSKALELLHQSKCEKRIMVDIEVPDPYSENAEQRIKRKNFYLKAGYKETPVKYIWRNENYEILSFGGQITVDEYEKFWEELMDSYKNKKEIIK